jgi:hypothetical protein
VLTFEQRDENALPTTLRTIAESPTKKARQRILLTGLLVIVC